MTAAETPKGASAALFLPVSGRNSYFETCFSYYETSVWASYTTFAAKINSMEASFIIAVALGVAIVVVLLGLVAALLYYRWRISDNNVHLEKFITENMELREKMRKAEHLSAMIRQEN